jgi:hypothetical protein
MRARAVPKGTQTTADVIEAGREKVRQSMEGLPDAEADADDQQAREMVSTITVRRHFKCRGKAVGEPEEDSEDLDVMFFFVDPAEVSLRAGRTISMGQFESVSVSVSVTVPCYREEMDEAAEFAQEKVRARLLEELDEGAKWIVERRQRLGAPSKPDEDHPF